MYEIIDASNEQPFSELRRKFRQTLNALEVGQGFVIPDKGIQSRRLDRAKWQIETGKRASIKRHAEGWLVVRRA